MKIDTLKEENSKIKKDWNSKNWQIQNKVSNTTVTMLTKVDKRLEDIGRKVEEKLFDKITEDFVIKTKQKLANLEHQSHQNHQEETSETWIISDFAKEKLGIEEERRHLNWKSISHGNMQRNDGTRNKKRPIVVKFLNFKSKSRILNAYRIKSHRRKKSLLTRISGGFSGGLAKENKRS